MRNKKLGKKVLAILLSAAIVMCCFPAMFALADFVSENLLETKIDMDNSKRVMFTHSTLTVAETTAGQVPEAALAGLVDGNTSDHYDFNMYSATDSRWFGVQYALTESTFAKEIVLYGDYENLRAYYDIYASNDLDTLYRGFNLVGEVMSVGESITLPVNRYVKYVALIAHFPLTEGTARPKEIQLWSGDPTGFTTENLLTGTAVASYKGVQFSNDVQSDYANNNGKFATVMANTTNSHTDMYTPNSEDPIGFQFEFDDLYYVGHVIVDSSLFNANHTYDETYSVYASTSPDDLFDSSNLVASGMLCQYGVGARVDVNKWANYVGIKCTEHSGGVRIRSISVWTGDGSNVAQPFVTENLFQTKLAATYGRNMFVSTGAVEESTRFDLNGAFAASLDGNTTNAVDVYLALDWDPARYVGGVYEISEVTYASHVTLYAGFTTSVDVWRIYASDSYDTLFDSANMVANELSCDGTPQQIELNKYVKYVAFFATGYQLYCCRIKEVELWSGDDSGVTPPEPGPGPDPEEPGFTPVNVLASNVSSSRCVQFYPSNHYVGDATRITEDVYTKFTDGDTSTKSDSYSALDWDPPRYIGIEYSLDDTYYIGNFTIYSGYTTSVDTFDVYASDSLDTLYSNDNCVATGINCDDTGAQTITVNKNVRYVTFLISGVELYCARIAEFEAWTADDSAIPQPFTPVNVIANNTESARCIQFYPTSHYVGDASKITAETIALFGDGDTSAKTDCYSGLDWDPPRYIGVEYTLDDTYYIGELKIYSGYTTSVDTFDVYASDSLDTLYNDANCVATGLDCDGTAAQTIAINKNLKYVTFLISGIELYCARIAEFEAWTADNSSTPPEPIDDGITRVLTIGNSFAENASIYASEIAYANNQKMVFGYLKYPSCSLQRHWNDIQNNVSEFKFRVTNETGAGTTVADGSSTTYTIQQAIDYADWDVVVFQQESSNARYYNTFSPYLQNLIDYVEGELPEARLLFHQVWRWGEWQADQFDLIKEASERMHKDYGLQLIPSGLAFEYAREQLGSATIINEDDGHYQHANRYGQYIEGCCYVATIFGIEIDANTFVSHPYVNDAGFVTTLTAAANNAVAYYGKAVGDADENGSVEGDDLTAIRKFIVNGTAVRKDIGDVTGNYEIDILDYVRLKKYLIDPENVVLR